MIIIVLLLTAFYLAAAIKFIHRRRADIFTEHGVQLTVDLMPLVIGLMPALVSVVMLLFFVVGGVHTTVQFNVGSDSHLDLWSTWVDLWPALVLLSFLWSFATFIVLVTSLLRKSARKIAILALCGLIINGINTLMVMGAFPSA